MNILLFFSFKTSLKTWNDSGMIDRELDFYKYLCDNHNCNFIFFTYGDKSDLEIELQSKNIEIIPIFNYVKKTKFTVINIIKSFYVLLIFKNKIRNITLIKCNQLNGSWLGIFSKLIFKKPLFIRTGYDAYIFSKLERKSYFKIILFYILTYWGLIFANLYSVSSKSDYKFLTKNYKFINIKKIIYRPNWVNIFNSSNIESKKEKTIISVGRLVEQKNYFYTLDSLKKTNYSLNIVGSGNLKSNLVNYSENIKVPLKIINNLKYKELINLLKNYEIFVLASTFEGNPKVLLEAMASKCLVLVSNISNNLEIIRNGENGLVFNISDPESLTNLLHNIDNKKIDIKKIQQNAFDEANLKYSMIKWAEREFKDFKNLIY